MAEFCAHHGTSICRDLLGLDLSTPEGQALAKERDTHHRICPAFVGDAAEIVARLLASAKG